MTGVFDQRIDPSRQTPRHGEQDGMDSDSEAESRAAKIARLKAQVQSGTYRNNNSEVASILLPFLDPTP